MSVRTCLVLAVLAAALGVGLRTALPVIPVDEPFRDAVRSYEAAERARGP